MRRKNPKFILGAGLIVIGLLVMLDELHIFNFDEELLVSFGFLFGGLALLSLYNQSKATWQLITGIFAIFIAIMIFIEETHIISDDFIGVLTVWLIAAGFFFVYHKNNRNWWAVIPAGFMFSVGWIVLLTEVWRGFDHYAPVIFFLGLSLTFGYLYSIRNTENKLDWAIWPAGATFFLCILVFSSMMFHGIDDFIFPAMLIIAGIYLIRRNNGSSQKNTSPEVENTDFS